MKPYLIVAGDFVRTGGMDVANLGLASFLSRSECDLHIVGHRAAPELTGRTSTTFHRVPKPHNAYTLGAPLLACAGLFQAARLKFRDATCIVNGGNCVLPGALNWVHYVHARYAPRVRASRGRHLRLNAMRQVALATERAALRAASVVIANSERTKRDVIERLGVAEERIRVIYYGIDGDAFRPASADERLRACEELGWNPERPRAVFVGALGDARKGFDVVFEAWRTLCARPSWDGDLVVIGAGDDLPIWREKARAAGIEERIAFLGFRSDVPRLLSACDVLVAPTRYEAYGLGVHEALCCGLPAIVSAEAGVAERYPENLKALLLHDPNDPTLLAERLLWWRERAHEGASHVREFSAALRSRSWDAMAADIAALAGGDA